MAATREKCAVPLLPIPLAAALGKSEPETVIELQKRGGKIYETIETFAVAPIAAITLAAVGHRVKLAVDDGGAEYFAVVWPEESDQERISWYAHPPDPSLSGDAAQTADQMLETRALVLCDYTMTALGKLLDRVPALVTSCIDMVEATTAANQDMHAQLREAAQDSADVAIAALKEDRLKEREAMGIELAKQWLAGKGEAASGAQALQVALAARLDAEDFDALKAHELGKPLFAATSAVAFRDAAIVVVQAVQDGEITLSPASLGRVVPWVQKHLAPKQD